MINPDDLSIDEKIQLLEHAEQQTRVTVRQIIGRMERKVLAAIALVAVGCFVATGFTIHYAMNAQHAANAAGGAAAKIRRTQREGRREFCELFDRNHQQAIRTLRQTEKYLADPSTKQHDPLTVAIRANLPQLRADLTASQVPSVCGPVLKREGYAHP